VEVGHSLRIVSRDAERALRHFGPGFEVAEADAESGLGVEAALEGCEGVFLSVAGGQEGAAVRNVVQAAGSEGVEQVVYVSGCTVSEENRWFPMIAQKLAAERALVESGLDWTVLAPGWFFETLARFVRGGRATLFGKDPNPYHFIAATEFGDMVARSFLLPEARNRRFVVHGPQPLTLNDALTRYLWAKHPEITRISRPPLWLLGLLARRKKNAQLKYALELMAYFEKVGELGDPSETNEVFGSPTTTLEEWVRQ
jgi:uncharacterized protein YbjT (DUF2867 family)